MLDIYDILSLTSAAACLIPGLMLLALLGRIKVPALRNLTIILCCFAILHGFYHLSYFIGLASEAPFIDLATAVILVFFGMYYSNRVLAASLFLIALPDVAAETVPVALGIALVIFVMLAVKSKSISSLQSQLSIFLIIWIVAEMLRALLLVGAISATSELVLLGLEIHTAAMIAFGLFLILRYYKVARNTTDKDDANIAWLTPKADTPSPIGKVVSGPSLKADS